MAFLKRAKSKEEIAKMTIGKIKAEYLELSNSYDKIINLEYIYCPYCGEFKGTSINFYRTNRTKSGFIHICKKCVLDIGCDYNSKTREYTDNKTKAKNALKLLDLPYIDSLYQGYVKSNKETGGGHNGTALQQTITSLKSLPQYKGLTWDNSEFEIGASELITEKDIPEEVKRRFGLGFSAEDYKYLEDQYQDWTSRTQVDSKSQELIIQRICFKQLDIWKAQKAARDTKDLDKSLNDLMASANLQPRQNVSNDSNDNLTFGQLIEKWEDSKPVPEPDEEFKDIDKIGLIVDVFFRGHLAKCVGLKNGLSNLYSRFMKKYTVTKPEYSSEDDDEIVFDNLFGSQIETNTEYLSGEVGG